MKIYFQKEDYTCWPSSIVNALNFFQIQHNEDEYTINEFIQAIPQEGASNESIIKFLENDKRINLVKHKVNWRYDDLYEYIDKGYIVLINYFNAFSNVGHYAIIYEYDAESFYFLDSSLWRLRLKNEILQKFWHNTKNDIKGFFIILGKNYN